VCPSGRTSSQANVRPDASSLLVILEPGTAELHRCTAGADGRPVASELVARFDCCLPQIDDPVVEWHEGAYWMQIRPGMFARVDPATAKIREDPLCGKAPGELGALLFFSGGRTFAAVRQGTRHPGRHRRRFGSTCSERVVYSLRMW